MIGSPYPSFFDLLGLPLENGYIYVGVDGGDPQVSPVQLYWDAALTIQATQPLRTTAGYIYRSGSPAVAYAAVPAYSMRVRDAIGAQVFYTASVPTKAGSSDVTFLPSGTGAQTRTVQDKLAEIWRSPEDFKGIATSDAAAIQAAHDAIVATGKSGVVRLTNGKTYSLTSGLTINTSYVSIEGDALLDFTALTGTAAAITVVCSIRSEYANSDGYKSAMRGNIVIKGPGKTSSTIGIDLNSTINTTAAQMLFEGVDVGRFGTGIRFSNRGYNNIFIKCDINENGVGVDWPAGGADNNERNTFIGCTIYNGDTAVRNYTSAATIALFQCSLDYNAVDYDVQYGRIIDHGSHHESIRWSDRPYRCDGDGSVILQIGGTIVNQAGPWSANHVVDTGTNGTVKLRDVFANNLLLTPLTGKSRTWATGTGRFEMSGFESFNFGSFPLRLSENSTVLSDPGFENALGQDLIWRNTDTVAITTRYGVQGTDNLSLSRNTTTPDTGTGALAAYKNGASGTAASFWLMCIPVRYGDKVLAGFRMRTDPSRVGTPGTVTVSPYWLKLDGHDSNRIPVGVRFAQIGSSGIAPTSSYQSVELMGSMVSIVAPSWATHFAMLVDMGNSAAATLLFDNCWADRC